MNAETFLLSTGMTENQISEMSDVVKLNIFQEFYEQNSLDDNIEFENVSSDVITMSAQPENGVATRTINPNRLKLSNYGFHNHQMGRMEEFCEFEWLILPLEQLLKNDSFSYALDGEDWNILPRSEDLSLYLGNGELYHKFTRPADGNVNGSNYTIYDGPFKEFRGVRRGVMHFSLRPTYRHPKGEWSTYLEVHYTQDISIFNSASYSINIGSASITLSGGGSNVDRAFLRTNLCYY